MKKIILDDKYYLGDFLETFPSSMVTIYCCAHDRGDCADCGKPTREHRDKAKFLMPKEFCPFDLWMEIRKALKSAAYDIEKWFLEGTGVK